MKRFFLVFVLSAVLWAPAARSAEIAALSLDDPAELGFTIVSDSEEKSEGAASLRIITGWPTRVNIGSVKDLNVEESVLHYRAKLKAKGLRGRAYLEMWAHMPDGQSYFSRDFDSAVTADSEWTIVETPFQFQKNQNPEKVTLNLVIKGTGTVWIDDVRLDTSPLPTE